MMTTKGKCHSIHLMFIILTLIVGLQCISLILYKTSIIIPNYYHHNHNNHKNNNDLIDQPTTSKISTSKKKNKNKKTIMTSSSSSSSSTISKRTTTRTVAAGGAPTTTTRRNNNNNKKKKFNNSFTKKKKERNDSTLATTKQHKMETTKMDDTNTIINTIPGRQGFYLPRELVEWDIDSDSNKFTKTICVISNDNYIAPTYEISTRFNTLTTNKKYEWKHLISRNNKVDEKDEGISRRPPPTKTTKMIPSIPPNRNNIYYDNLCKYSRIRHIFERTAVKSNKNIGNNNQQNNQQKQSKTYYSKLKLQHLQEHIEGEQLTNALLRGGHVDKGTLNSLILENSSSSSTTTSKLLKNSMPKTYIFDSTQSCIDFCNNEWHESTQSTSTTNEQWIWKPKLSAYGNGITGIGPTLKDCNGYCKSDEVGGGDKLTAQLLMMNPMTLPIDNRKFDVRSNILVASVDPLIIYTGGEYVRICAEPFFNTNNSTTTTSTTKKEKQKWEWNQFQHVCNMAVSKQHHSHNTLTTPKSTYVRPFLSDPSVIPNTNIRNQIINKLDQVNHALVELLYEERWNNTPKAIQNYKKYYYDDNNNTDNDNDNKHRNKIGMFQLLAADYLVDNTSQHNIVLLELNRQPGFTADFGINYPNPWGDIMLIEWTIIKTYQQYYNNNKNNDNWKTVLEKRLSELELETLRRLPL